MKKLHLTLSIFLLIFTVSACGQKTPSLDDVTAAIENGSLTVEDALEKGYITSEWADNYNASKMETAIPAADKTLSNLIGNFEATTLDGNLFTQDDLHSVTYFAFINPTTPSGVQAYNIIQENYDAVTEAGGQVLIINTSSESDLFNAASFPVIHYNDSLKTALGSLDTMVADDFSGSWNGNGAFLSAWNSQLDSEAFISTMYAIMDLVD